MKTKGIHRACSSVDRAPDSEPGGRGFNSRHAQKKKVTIKNAPLVNTWK
jgi:hypothetical protein